MIFNYDVKVKLTDKNERTFRIVAEQTDKFYKLTHQINGEIVGFLSFGIKDKYAWLYKIETDEAYQHQGIGTALIYTMEYLLMLEGVKRVEAKYYPDNKFAKPFYLKNDYFIPNQTGRWEDYDEDWTMSKNLDFSNIRSKIAPNVRPIRIVENEREK